MLIHALIAAVSMLIMRLIARERTLSGAGFIVNAGAFSVLYFFGLLVALSHGDISWDMHQAYLPQFIAGGLGFAVYNISIYKLLTYFDVATSSILSMFRILFTVIVAAIILQEQLSLRQILGTVLLVASIVYVLQLNRDRKQSTNNNWLIGLGIALAGSLVVSFANVNEKYLLGQMDTNTYIVFGWGWQFVMSLMLAATQRKQVRYLLAAKMLPKVFLAGLTLGIGGYLFIISAVKTDNIAVVSVVSNFRVVIAVLLSAMLLRERQQLGKKLTATLVSMLGIVLIFWK